MIRVIKRYGSRKLYDTEESRYVSLEEIAVWVRSGQEIRVVDNGTGEDVTTQTLAQIILEEGRRGSPMFSSELLHQLIRRGEDLVTSGIGQLQDGVDRALQASLDRIPPLRKVREETVRLRQRLDALEASIADMEASSAAAKNDDDNPDREAARTAGKRKGAHQ